MRQSINRKVIRIVVVFLFILTCMVVLFGLKYRKYSFSDNCREQVLALNEIEKLTQVNGVSTAGKQIAALEQDIMENASEGKNGSNEVILLFLYAACVIFVLVLFLYIYCIIVKPFDRLQKYAGEIAKGNMEVSLSYERSNFFGAFTWAFDHMRREIKKARACEKEAIENNKTVIATLSHDIKTPIASIRAYAEGLEANMDSDAERRGRYLTVIMNKCDEVTKLTNDLFLHAISDLDKLQIQTEPINIREVILQTVEEMEGDRKDIILYGYIDKRTINADRKRTIQVLENIINNARKYAGGGIMTIWTEIKPSVYEIHIKDQGPGIFADDLPFIFEKFYRGKNIGTSPGSGLGLYIVKYIMNQMNGEVYLYNRQDGLEVILQFNGECGSS
jgi:signal transduction histidine kinase